MKNGIISFLCVLTILSVFTSCSGKETSAVGIYDLQKAMLGADDSLPEMKTVNSSSENAEDLFSYLSDMDYSKVKSFFLSYCADGKLADEIAVIELKNSADKNEALQSIKNHVDKRVKLYSSYGPDQVKRAQSALTFDKGNYVALIISNKQSEIKSAFENLVNQ